MLSPGWWHTTAVWFESSLSGMGPAWSIALVLALTTLLLEDLAIAAGVALAAKGSISWELSLLAVAGGIAIGDLGLYWAGHGARRIAWLKRRFIGERTEKAGETLHRNLPSAVLLARVIPGLRLLTYTASGFLEVPLMRFVLWVCVAVTLWTVGLYGLSVAIGHALTELLGVPAPFAVALPIVVLAIAVPLWRFLQQKTKRTM